MFRALFSRLFSHLRHDKTEREMDDEMRFHLELVTKENLDKGMSVEEARREARRSFGSVDQMKEACRDVSRLRLMEDVWQDLRYGARMLIKNPGFTVVAVLTLALGIGVNSAIFTLFDLAVLRPFPVKDPETIVNLGYWDKGGYSFTDYVYFRDHTQVFSDLIASSSARLVIGGQTNSEEPQIFLGEMVSDNYFSTLGARTVFGRTFTAEENRTPGQYPLVVLSYALWQGRFGADPNILGQAVRLNTKSFVVIGVMSPDFVGLASRRGKVPDLWLPVMMASEIWPQMKHWFSSREEGFLDLFGRLKDSQTVIEARAEMAVLLSQLSRTYPEINPKARVAIKPLWTLIGSAQPKGSPWAILGGVLTPTLIVLLIACSNIANLQLARAAARQKEIGVRLCLGASRSRVIRQLLTESILLAILGGSAGLLLAWWSLKAFLVSALSFTPLTLTTISAVKLLLQPDWRILGFTLLLSLLSAVVFGLVPALHATRGNLVAAIKDEGVVFSQRMTRSRLRSGLVVAQVALCLVLLIAAGLLLRGFMQAGTMAQKLKTGDLFTLHPLTAQAGYDQSRARQFGEDLAARLDGLPGIQAMTRVQNSPRGMTLFVKQEDGRHAITYYYQVAPNYFDTVGLPILRGRAMTEEETRAGAAVVVVTEATAQKLWPNQNPIGQSLPVELGTSTGWALTPHQVIGVAQDALQDPLMGQEDEAEHLFLYAPLLLRQEFTLLVRTSREASGLRASVRAVAHTLDANLMLRISSLDESFDVAERIKAIKLLSGLASGLGLLALLLAAIGLYGVMAYSVAQRTREIGIRMALGAQPRDVLRMVTRQGLRLVSIGVALGVMGGVAVSRVLRSVLFGLSPFDPIAYVSVSLFLVVVALLAIYLPARRAAKVDPMVALRYE